MTANTAFEPFELHSLTAKGVNVRTGGRSEITAKGVVLYVGQSVTVTEEIHALNRNIHGECVFDLTAEQQRERWGEVRFGKGEVPNEALIAAREEQRARLAEEREHLLKANPHLARQTAASSRLGEIDAELEK
jgi:hypothetical protein